MLLSVAPLNGLDGLFSTTVSAEVEGYYTYTIEDNKATITKIDPSISGDITIPSKLGEFTVTSISDGAIWFCSSLTGITIPNTVNNIAEKVFFGCSELTSIKVVTDNPKYSSADGVLFNKDKTLLIQYPYGSTRSNYTIPNSVNSIGPSAFSDCLKLTEVIIPSSVTSIGESAFSFCLFLTNIVIPNSVTEIGESAFYFCTALSNVTIGNSVKKLEIGHSLIVLNYQVLLLHRQTLII